ncbi:MAG: 1-(5-phosphoribosyl)-5-[(5-phosphoribosylamino)methylideneamino]imidazole-4-carboxamide isomerase [Actinobacteria bacterium]|nr:1-(5-phosphoribosyl)-5-[(5-phosphoribosylamino)methylideneamino]imidazole-4-carboxamide isomerase [Actinomycetota bacterium]
MEIIPAIDLIDGACVRLYKGDYGKKVKYFDDPVEVAEKWLELGAKWIHLIDLDGARTGFPKNLEIAARIKKKYNAFIEYGGGIRSLETLHNVMEAGVDKIIIGTKAIENLESLKEYYIKSKGKIIISLDFGKGNKVFKKGWLSGSDMDLFDFGKKIKDSGINEVIITDISRDGTLEGLNINVIKEFLRKTNLEIYVAGGVSGINDIKKLKEIESHGIKGIIIGKALYEGKINLKEALEIG